MLEQTGARLTIGVRVKKRLELYDATKFHNCHVKRSEI